MYSVFSMSMALACATFAFPQHNSDERATPGKTILNGPVTIDFDTSAGKSVVEVKINGKGPYRFFLDTGAGGMVINDDLARELGLPVVGSTELGDPSNPHAIKANRVHIDRLDLGGAAFQDIVCASWDRSILYPGGDAPRGIVGFPLFAECLLTLDYPAGKITLSKDNLPSNGEGIIKYRMAEGGIAEIDVQVAGKTHAAHIDSGSMGGIGVNDKLAEKLKWSDKPVVVGHGRSANSEFQISAATLDGNVNIAGNVFKNPKIEISSMLRAVNIGSRALQNFIVTFDQRQNLVRIQPPTGAKIAIKEMAHKPQGKPRLGIMIAMENSEDQSIRRINEVVADSPAEKAGLKAGDLILEIGGKDAAKMDEDAFRHELASNVIVMKIKRDDQIKDFRINLSADASKSP